MALWRGLCENLKKWPCLTYPNAPWRKELLAELTKIPHVLFKDFTAQELHFFMIPNSDIWHFPFLSPLCAMAVFNAFDDTAHL